MGKKRGFFTLDAILAASIFFFVLLLATNFYAELPETTAPSVISQDMVRVFTQLEVDQLDSEYVKSLIQSDTIVRENNSVFEQIGEFWAENELELAENLSREVADVLVDPKLGFGIYVDGETIYERNKSVSRTLIATKKIITGLAKDKPIEGFTSRAFLSSISSKRFSAYSYLGGFIGQGNVTASIDSVPGGVTLEGMYMELDVSSDFNLFINDVQCSGIFAASSGELEADFWNISSCLGSVQEGGINNFTFEFLGGIIDSFIGGGFVQVDYQTDVFNENETLGTQVHDFPKIIGIINLYDSVYIPGPVLSMEANLHYTALFTNFSNTLYLTIGNTTVARIANVSGEGTLFLNDSNLSAQLSYGSLAQSTVPLRIGFENVSFDVSFEGNADVSLITDLSGSMARRMDNDNTGTLRNCGDASYDDPSTQRMSVAKCLDFDFIKDILNISGNEIGLVGFESSTISTVDPTTNVSLLNNTVGTSSPYNGYTASGGTCICCGINSAASMLNQDLLATTIIAAGSTWSYYDGGFDNAPADDPSGNAWSDFYYENDTSWPRGPAILGTTNGVVYTPTVTTEVGFDLVGNVTAPDLWEHGLDNPGVPNDFSSGILNYTAITYGLGAGDDGWDYDGDDSGAGPFGFDDDIEYFEVLAGRLAFDSSQGSGNSCSNRDCSAAYAIELEITQNMVNTVAAGGIATLSFDYEWDDTGGNRFENADQVWVKARWTSPLSGAAYLGSTLDGGHSGSDTDFEIATANNPDNDFSGTASVDLSTFIDQAGMHYLEIGGKMRASASNEHGAWYFDNIQVSIGNSTDFYFYRTNFTINNQNLTRRAFVNVLADEKATVYVNGQIIDEDTTNQTAEYWNRRGFPIDGSILVEGINTVAVKVTNTGSPGSSASKFDLELIGLNDSRDKAMLVMSDGQATSDSGCPQTGTAVEEAIEAACDAREDWGIRVFSVGYSASADNDTLEEIAACGEGIFASSANSTQLEDFYEDVALNIVTASRHSQTIDVVGTLTESILHEDSWLAINYTPVLSPPAFNEIALQFKEEDFLNCTHTFEIYPPVRVTEAVLTSYSSEHWTDAVLIDNITVYNLSTVSPDYTALGDPYIVNIPPVYMTPGNHTIDFRTGDSLANNTGCSENNSLIYTGMVTSTVAYSEVLIESDGCTWTIENEDGDFLTIPVTSSYVGPRTCNYTGAQIGFDGNNSNDVAVHDLISQLDFDGNGRINIDIDQSDLIIDAIFVPNVPSLWGPAVVEVRVWE